MHFCSARRTPRAGVDPIRDAASALAVVRLAMHDPPADETIALVLDDDRRGHVIVVATGTTCADDVYGVVECVTAGAVDDERFAGLVLATVRPGGRALAGDVDRWLELSDACEQAGVELVEWFVLSGHRGRVTCPRDLLGERPRW